MNSIKVEIVQDVEYTLERWGDWNNQDCLKLGYPGADVSVKMVGNGGISIPPLDDITAMKINDALAPLKMSYNEAWLVAEAIYIKKLPMCHKKFPVSYNKATRIRAMVVGLVMNAIYSSG